MHQRLQFGADRLKAKQAQQTVYVVDTGHPESLLNITSVTHKPHRGFWRGVHGEHTHLVASKGLPFRAP